MVYKSPSRKGEERRKVRAGTLRRVVFVGLRGKNGGPSPQNQEDILKPSSAPLALLCPNKIQFLPTHPRLVYAIQDEGLTPASLGPYLLFAHLN